MITTHILDISLGRPASGVAVTLETRSDQGGWELLGKSQTDTDGRVRDLVSQDHLLVKGIYRLTFETGPYFASQSVESFYPEVSVIFTLKEPTQHYHVPLLLSPYGYSTYRGS